MNLKKYYISSLGFHKNAKDIVVGVYRHNQSRISPSVATVEQAVKLAMKKEGYTAYDVLVRFYGPKEKNQ